MSDDSASAREQRDRGIEPEQISPDEIRPDQFKPWWQRSAPLAGIASLAIGAGTLWFGNMLSRVPLDRHSTFGYLLMLPLLLIVPAFSAAGLRLAWIAFGNRQAPQRILVVVLALTGAAANLLAISRFITALTRIFGN